MAHTVAGRPVDQPTRAAVGLLTRRRGQPILVYYTVAYVIGLTVTAGLKLAGTG
jgi:hypothetical protein